MKSSFYQKTIENQFDYICEQAMEDERKDYFKQLSRLAKNEVSFSEIGDQLVSQIATLYILSALYKSIYKSNMFTDYLSTLV